MLLHKLSYAKVLQIASGIGKKHDRSLSGAPCFDIPSSVSGSVLSVSVAAPEFIQDTALSVSDAAPECTWLCRLRLSGSKLSVSGS